MKKNVLSRSNLIFGLVLFVLFLITGYYMKAYFKPQHLIDLEERLQIRSNHIYILFISFLNLSYSICHFEIKNKLIYYLNISFRALIILAGIVAFLAFCFEHNGDISNKILTFASIVLSLISIGLLLTTELVNRRNQ